ncbi:MAG: CGNR zinc finger domain-containing protein [Candidatus Eremiobacteraeota bacterium]|nr:CGNR zinc finger domain-containing protein [Candidatus Eremiobacteraeota bacterium]
MTDQLSATPAGLEFVEKFLNTIEVSEERDDLAPASAIERWAAERGIEVALTEEDGARIRAFREALRGVLETNAGHGAPDEAWARLTPYVYDMCFTFRTSPVGFTPQGTGADRLVGTVVAAVYESVERGTFSRLKVCPESTCRWAFYDQSKNKSGRWCSMAVCGNRNKARRRRSMANAPQPTN